MTTRDMPTDYGWLDWLLDGLALLFNHYAVFDRSQRKHR